MSLARVQTLILAYRAWMCAILGPLLAHSQLVIAHLRPIGRNTRMSLSPLNRSANSCIEEILGRSILPLRKAIIGWRSRRRINTIILAKELPRSYQNLNQAFAGYE